MIILIKYYIYQYQMYTYRMHRVYIGYAYPIKNSKKIAKVLPLAINVLLFPPSIKRTGVTVSVFPSACNRINTCIQIMKTGFHILDAARVYSP